MNKPKVTKTTPAKELAELKKVMIHIESSCKIQLLMWDRSNGEYHKGANSQAKHILSIIDRYTKPAARDKGDDML